MKPPAADTAGKLQRETDTVKILIERTAERPAAREIGSSRAIVQNTDGERLEIEISEPSKEMSGELGTRERQSLQTDRAELKTARRIVDEFLRRSNQRFEADNVAEFELSVLARSPHAAPFDSSTCGGEHDVDDDVELL